MFSLRGLPNILALALYQVKVYRRLPVIGFARADYAWLNRRYDDAVRYYTTSIARHPFHPAILQYRLKFALSLLRVSRIQDAEAELERILLHTPNHEAALSALAIIKRWCGRNEEAAWILHRYLQRNLGRDSLELRSLFVLCAFDSGSRTLEGFARATVQEFTHLELGMVKPQLALARHEMAAGRSKMAFDILAHLTRLSMSPIDAFVYAAELCVSARQVDEAKYLLQRALAITPEYPLLNTMLAEIYLKAGDPFNPDYAHILAETACRQSGWVFVRAIQTLAEAYYHKGERLSALLAARRAKIMAQKQQGSGHVTEALDHLIDSIDSDLAAGE